MEVIVEVDYDIRIAFLDFAQLIVVDLDVGAVLVDVDWVLALMVYSFVITMLGQVEEESHHFFGVVCL